GEFDLRGIRAAARRTAGAGQGGGVRSGGARPPASARAAARAAARGTTWCMSPVRGGGLRYNDQAITAGAQTEGRGEVAPVGVQLGGGHAPAALRLLFLLHSQ